MTVIVANLGVRLHLAVKARRQRGTPLPAPAPLPRKPPSPLHCLLFPSILTLFSSIINSHCSLLIRSLRACRWLLPLLRKIFFSTNPSIVTPTSGHTAFALLSFASLACSPLCTSYPSFLSLSSQFLLSFSANITSFRKFPDCPLPPCPWALLEHSMLVHPGSILGSRTV